MFDPKSFEILLGQSVVDALREEQLRTCRPGKHAGTFVSADVCALQARQYARGVRGIELVEATLAPVGIRAAWDVPQGWTVRADHHGHALLASSRDGEVDGSLESAMQWARWWVCHDPANRYAWKRR